MDFREKKLYHQIHPLKLAADIGVTPVSLYFVSEHRALPALLVGFVPPRVVSLTMLKWTPDLENIEGPRSGVTSRKDMVPSIELTRLLTRSGVKPRPLGRGYKPVKARFFVVECSP
jgi:hypothetical protein